MYYKQSTGTILVRKSAAVLDWVKWVHQSLSENHCEECLKLDGCLFSKNNHPTWPHHPYCHCILESVSYGVVAAIAVADSAYSKFDPYLFNTTGSYTH
jgi:hypothetical protein